MFSIIGYVLLGFLLIVISVPIGYRFFGRYSWRVYHVTKGPWYAMLLLYPAAYYARLLNSEPLLLPHVNECVVASQPLDSPDNLKRREDYSRASALIWPLRLIVNPLMIVLLPIIFILLIIAVLLFDFLVDLTVHRPDRYLAARKAKPIVWTSSTTGGATKEPPQTLDALRPTLGFESQAPQPPPPKEQT